MTRYVYRPKDPQADEFGMIDATLAAPMGVDPRLYIIRDEMDPTRNMANGKHYTSKAKFRQATRDAGCVEVGNDSSLTSPRKPIALDRNQRFNDIKHTIEQLRSRGRHE